MGCLKQWLNESEVGSTFIEKAYWAFFKHTGSRKSSQRDINRISMTDSVITILKLWSQNPFMLLKIIKNLKQLMWLYHFIANNQTFINLSFKYSSKYFHMQNNYIAPKLQLTPEQWGFELNRSICIPLFFNSKYYSTTHSLVGWLNAGMHRNYRCPEWL